MVKAAAGEGARAQLEHDYMSANLLKPRSHAPARWAEAFVFQCWPEQDHYAVDHGRRRQHRGEFAVMDTPFTVVVAEDAARRPATVPDGARASKMRGILSNAISREVECGALAASPGNEAHLHAFATEALTTAGERRTLYLTPRRSSPARNCSPPARRASSISRASSATASAGRCMLPNSRCSNGTVPMRCMTSCRTIASPFCASPPRRRMPRL